jgi:hypothetical protein
MAVNIIQLDPQDLTTQIYESQDLNLIPSFEIDTLFTEKSYIEFFIYDLSNSLLYTEQNFTQYSILNDGQSSLTNDFSQININPLNDLENLGFSQGEYITYYNFLNKEIGSEIEPLYISEISFDRTELRLDSIGLSPEDIIELTNNFIQKRESSNYFYDFYLNFGNNTQLISNNIALDNSDLNNPTILIKLYEPLPQEIILNSTLWIVSTIEESVAYQVSFIEEPITFNDTISIQGPNFNIEIKDQVNNSTQELSYFDLLNTSLTSSQNQINSLLEEKELDINIDYTNFEDFIHFSSAKTRLENFYYKVSLLENYSSSISQIESNITGSTSSSFAVNSSKTTLENQISDIIKNFDGYDYYLYYSSGSYAWPKTTTEPPYSLALTGSAAVTSWFTNIISSASFYDSNNKDNLFHSIPEYLREDSDNRPYELFIDMVAQHFDNIWIYYKDVTQKYNNDNRLEYGISKDIVADAIRDFGIKLYQNNFSNEDLYTAFLGLTPEGGLFPFPNITGSLPTPSGFEYVDTLISASNDYLPLDDVNKSLYKRIYHNLPYLLKTKGTLPGLRALITSYGIPDTILRINEYGGKDKVNSNDWDYWQNEFNYAFKTEGNNFITTPWQLNSSWNSPNSVSSTLKFRFKTNDLPTSSIAYSQSLWFNNLSSSITLTYTGSAYSSSSYSGSIIDPYYQYATLTFHPNASSSPSTSASIYLPFYDNGWWSVMVNRSGSNFTLSAGNKIYEGGDNGTLLGFYASSSIVGSITAWTGSKNSSFAKGPLTISTKTYTAFSGSLQEIRYYANPISESVFKDYIMNPYSIEGNSLNSSPNELAFRLPLGGELYTSSISIHPKITGSWTSTSSFFIGHSSASFNSTPTFIPNTEYFFYDQPVAGIRNSISDKIRLEGNTLPTGSTLSPLRRLEQNLEISSSYTPNVNYLEVAFSPQNEINEDIMGQLGFFNIGEFIGNPNERFSNNSYPDLNKLRNEYFEKYTKNYDLVDFIRLIKFFDNSLFKMIKDFVPARTSLASGIVIKQHLLERNKYPHPQVEWEDVTYSGSIEIGEFSGGTGGVLDIFNGINTSPYGLNGNGPENIFDITQSWVETTPSLLGAVSTVHDSQEEFYDGEFSGSVILVTTQNLNQPFPQNYIPFSYKHVYYFSTGSGEQNIFISTFSNSKTSPQPGEILFLCTIPGSKPFFGNNAVALSYTVTHLKISKQDCNNINNTLPLGQLTQLLIKIPPFDPGDPSQVITYDINGIQEYSDYYLYETLFPSWTIPQQIGGPSATNKDQQLFDYAISASKSIPKTILFSTQVIDVWDTSPVGTNLPHYGTPYFNTSSGYLTLENTPNTPIQISASITTNGTVVGSGKFDIIVNGESIAGTTYNTNVLGVVTTLNAVYYGVQEDILNIKVTRPFIGAGTVTLVSASLNTTQLRGQFNLDNSYLAPLNSSCSLAILEPYISSPNFYNSDQNALLNDVFENRLSTKFQDIDYNTGTLTPTNFELLISGSATKAMVQDSNYTTKRHILPRYEGSKSTSQFLNKWSPPNTILGYKDEGTYGKQPTVESLKNYVAYCDFIGGWPPERMNASGAHILYLIKDDGTIVIPNTSENSLSINKGTFESNERVSITSKNISTSGETNFRNIIRGGTKIEPILYTQIGHTPTSWAPSMSFVSTLPIQDTSSYGDYQAKYSSLSSVRANNNTFGTLPFQTEIYLGSGASWSTERYTVTSNAVLDNINITLNGKIYANFVNNIGGNSPARTLYMTAVLVKQVGANLTILDTHEQVYPFNSNNSSYQFVFNLNYTIPSSDLNTGDDYFIRFKQSCGNPPTPSYPGDFTLTISPSSLFDITQNPTPTNFIVETTGSNEIWGYPDPINYPYVITSSNPVLVASYGDPYIKQENISGSGFNNIELPWSIKYGDEFRFEGNENQTYMVKTVYEPGSNDNRLFNSSSIEVHFNSPLPVNASSSIFNLDHFLIRRYVDDASLILLEGFKPIGSEGPFIVKPEFVSPGLNRSIDEFILDLTQKGLL